MMDTYRKEWLEDLFDTYYDKVYSFLYAKVGNFSITEDLTCQTFLKIAEKHHTYNEKKGALSTWIFTIALNEMRDHFRSRKCLQIIDLEDISHLQADVDIEQCVIENEDRKNLYSLIASLGESEQNIILLKYFGDMSNKEIAVALELSNTNVGTILNRTIKKMRNMCDETRKTTYKKLGGDKNEQL